MFNWHSFTTELIETKRLSNPPSERKDQQKAAKFRAQKVAKLYQTIQKSGGPGPKTQELLAKRRKQFMLMKLHQRKAYSKYRNANV